jgi:hypothetical protein
VILVSSRSRSSADSLDASTETTKCAACTGVHARPSVDTPKIAERSASPPGTGAGVAVTYARPARSTTSVVTASPLRSPDRTSSPFGAIR